MIQVMMMNKENCKEADTKIREQANIDFNVIKGEDNKYYYLLAQNNVAAYTLIPETDNSYVLYDFILPNLLLCPL